MSDTAEALIAEYDSTPTPPSLPPPTYVEAPLENKAARIWLRAASPPTHHPSEIPSPQLLLPSTTYRDDLPEADMLLRTRARFTTLICRFEVGESLSAAVARQAGHTLAHTVDYGFIDTMDASIRSIDSRAMIAVGEDDRALLGAHVIILTKERIYFCSMASSYEHESIIVSKIIYALQRQDLRMDQRMLVVAISIVTLLAILYSMLSFMGYSQLVGCMDIFSLLAILYGMLSIMGDSQLAFP
nr:hypothetical protein [Tanacetum cinerariifolium]